MREIDYNIATLGPDDLYRLLPYIVRSTDPNEAIRVVFNALTEFHNHAAQKLREMPRLQDPEKCGKFTPEDFGESMAVYTEYLDLIYRSELEDATAGEKEYLESLKNKIPQSLKARSSELEFLGLLSDTVGVKLVGRFVTNIIRSWIKTGVARSHISGTHSSIAVIGRVLGFVDLKVAELWSRFALKDPGEPKAVRNDIDFSYESEAPPYYPISGEYGNVEDLTKSHPRSDGYDGGYTSDETLQTPYGSITYNPNVLDDANFTYVITFDNVTHVVSSRLHYNLLINDHNPFGNFASLVTKKLKTGSYTLADGSDQRSASVSISAEDGSEAYVFRAITPGSWANDVTLTISNLVVTTDVCDPVVDYDLLEAQQRVTISGPQSSIKFKSSYFDLITAIDPTAFLLHFPAIKVVTNKSMRVVGDTFTYTVDVPSNSMDIVVSDDATAFLHEGDTVLITNSTSQYDDDGFLVNRNNPYVVKDVSMSAGDCHIVVELFGGENAERDDEAWSRVSLEVASIADDGSGKALLYFSDVLSTSNTDPVEIVNSFSGLYDGEYEVFSLNSTYNSIKLYNPDSLVLVDYNAGVTDQFGDAVFRGTGYVDGVIPSGSGSPETNGSIIKVYPEGQSTGSYPVLGTVDGWSEQADPDTNYQLNLKSYFELIGIIRELVNDLKPLTRTMRKDINGLFFKDDVHYAPLLVESEVVLESPAGNRFKLSVALGYVVKWLPTTDEPTTVAIIQRDINGKFYTWSILDTGVISLSSTSLAEDSVLVYFKATNSGEVGGYVFVYNGVLIASANATEGSVESIHLRDGSESYLDAEIENVVESIPERAAQYMGAAAFSTDAPSDSFAFQQSPEDELSQNTINLDHVFGHVHLPWLNDVRLQWVNGKLVMTSPVTLNKDGFSEGLWFHYFNSDDSESWSGAEFRGQDPRWDNRGIETGLIEPVPSGSSVGYGLDHNYPVWFLNHHNLYAWRDRVTGEAKYSQYSHSSAASNMGPDKIDVDLSYLDGPMEPVSGSGILYHDIAIDKPWKKSRSRVITPPDLNYSTLTNSGGFVRINFSSYVYLLDVYAGVKVFFEDESGYTDSYQILEVGEDYITISAPYTAGSTAAEDSRFFWIGILELDLWESGDDNKGYVAMQPLSTTQASGSVGYKVYVNSTPDLAITSDALAFSDTLLFSEDKTTSFDPTEVDIIPADQQKRTLMLCISCGSGSFAVYATLSQDAATGVLSNTNYGGSLAWQGASRDVLEVTLMTLSSTGSVLDENPFDLTLSSSHITAPSSTQEGMTIEVDSPTRNLWRGGVWAENL